MKPILNVVDFKKREENMQKVFKVQNFTKITVNGAVTARTSVAFKCAAILKLCNQCCPLTKLTRDFYQA